MTTFNISGPIDEALVLRFMDIMSTAQINEDKGMLLIINSQGGDEQCGRAIAGLIKRMRDCGSPVHTIGVGDIHSSAVLIFASGERRMLSKFASVMVHESSAEVDGNSSTIKAYAKQMEKDEQFWCGIMEQLTGTDTKTWMKLHADETYLTPQECLNLNLATELI